MTSDDGKFEASFSYKNPPVSFVGQLQVAPLSSTTKKPSLLSLLTYERRNPPYHTMSTISVVVPVSAHWGITASVSPVCVPQGCLQKQEKTTISSSISAFVDTSTQQTSFALLHEHLSSLSISLIHVFFIFYKPRNEVGIVNRIVDRLL